MILATLFSILAVITLWFGFLTTDVMSLEDSFAYFGMEVFIVKPSLWISFVIAGGIILIALNLLVVIGREKTAQPLTQIVSPQHGWCRMGKALFGFGFNEGGDGAAIIGASLY